MKKNKKGFTLIELLVTISIIGIIVIGASKINFNPQINKQNSLMFSNDIYTNIEMVRNNSLLGKGISNGTSIIHPDKWVVNITTTTGGTGSIKGSYLTGGVLQNYNDFKVNFANSYYKISKLTCYNIDKSSQNVINNLDLEIKGSTLTLSGCTSPNNKIIDIKTEYKDFSKIIRINTISGLIEKVDN